MFDPFPFPAPPALAIATRRLSANLNLDTLPLHIHEILLFATLYHFICSRISPWVSGRLFPHIYPKLPERTRINWDVHVVSLVQSVLVSGVSLWVMFYDEERAQMDWKERIWGYTGATGLVAAMAQGYFFWDLYISTVYLDIFGWGLLAHALSAFVVFSLGFRPFVHYYAPVFVLYEISSPFLNFHWFFDKVGMTGSNAQLINGILLMASFFGSRLVWGVFQSFNAFSDIFRALKYQDTRTGKLWIKTTGATVKDEFWSANPLRAQIYQYVHGKRIPTWYAYTYLGSNILLTLLNVYWFGKMIETIRRRFEPPFGTKPREKKTDVVMGRGVHDDGTKTVEIGSSEVKKRKTVKIESTADVPPPS